MRVDIGDLVAELKALRKGRGLDTPDILPRIGPALRTTFSLASDAGPAQVRTVLTTKLTELAARLHPDFAAAVATALGLAEDSHTRLYGDRVALVARQIHRDRRTASRRIDEGIQLLAQLAIAELSKESPGGRPEQVPWRTRALRTWVVLDRDVTEVYEMRRITTSVSEVREVRLEVSVPVPENWDNSTPIDDPEIVVLTGGTLRARTNYSSSRVVFDLELAQPLTEEAEHEFFVRFRFSGTRRMGPFYACTPSFPCEFFDLHVRFAPDRPPAAVWKVDGLRMSEVNDSAAPRGPIRPDSAGEVKAVFRDLTPNLSYGIAWDERRSLGSEPAHPAHEQDGERNRHGEQDSCGE